MKLKTIALGAAVTTALSLEAAEPAWPANFAADYAQHVAAVKASGTTDDAKSLASAFAAGCRAEDRSAGYGSAAEPFDARFYVEVATLPVKLANPSGLVLLFK